MSAYLRFGNNEERRSKLNIINFGPFDCCLSSYAACYFSDSILQLI